MFGAMRGDFCLSSGLNLFIEREVRTCTMYILADVRLHYYRYLFPLQIVLECLFASLLCMFGVVGVTVKTELMTELNSRS